eukprot:XP_001697707.1 predicted protein [Chlamydomonas reinhardtii]
MMLSHKSSLGTSKAALPSRTPAAMMSMLPVHQRPAAAVRARGSRAVTRAVAESLVSRDDEGLRLRGPQTLVLPTIFARTTGTNNKPVLVKANVVLPPSAGKLPQDNMVQAAAFWRQRIANNDLPGLNLISSGGNSLGGESFSTDVLPWVLAVLWGALALWLPALGLSSLRELHEGAHARPPAASSGAGGGVDAAEAPRLPDERVMAAGYLTLAATVTAIEMALPPFAFDSVGQTVTSLIKLVFLILAVGSWPALLIYPYEAAKQRPEARRQVRDWFRNTLVASAAEAGGAAAGAGKVGEKVPVPTS